MANVNINLAGASLQVFDTLNTFFRVNVPEAALVLPASVALYDAYFAVAAGAGTAITLPAATIWFAWVRNLSGTANITVQHQATGGALQTAANSLILTPQNANTPGGIWMYANPTEGAGGLIGLTLISSIAGQPVEILLGA
jgi:hypothetical protein